MDYNLLACASPFNMDADYARFFKRKASFATYLARALIREFNKKQLPLWVFSALECLADGNVSGSNSAWAPEIPSLLRWLSGKDARLPLLKIQTYALRSSGINVCGNFSDSSDAGFGALNGVPARELAGREFSTKDRDLVLYGEVRRELASKKLAPSLFTGSSDLFKAIIDTLSDNSMLLQVDPDAILSRPNSTALNILAVSGVPLEWITSAITTLYVTDYAPNSSRSGSWDNHCGLSYYSRREDTIQIADVLLHEACHQNFYFLNLDESLHEDDNIQRLSPAVQQNRPIWALLLAYHAFANVAIFYSMANVLKDEKYLSYAFRNFDYAKKTEKILDTCIFRKPKAKMFFDNIKSRFKMVEDDYLYQNKNNGRI